MRGALAACATALLLLNAAPARADIDDYLGRRIASVAMESEGRRVTDARVSDLVETRVGEPLGMAAVRESITHLFSLGRYEDIRVHG